MRLILDAATDGRELLAVPAALQHNIPAPPVGQDLALTGGVPEAGHEALAQLPAVAVLQDVGVAGDMVLFQNGRDLVCLLYTSGDAGHFYLDTETLIFQTNHAAASFRSSPSMM